MTFDKKFCTHPYSLQMHKVQVYIVLECITLTEKKNEKLNEGVGIISPD